jgi:basic amino acid/polyamine antiporter, APA family
MSQVKTTSPSSIKQIGFYTALALVVANMVGTGVFTSLGFQLYDIQSPFAILMLWIVGGIIALCGALVYGELGLRYPDSGGEYNYLSKIYHPLVGFMSAWVSSVVGFAAPIALAAMALGKYFDTSFDMHIGKWLGILVIILITLIHSVSVKRGASFQRYFTLIKIIFILFFIVSAFFAAPMHHTSIAPLETSWSEIFSKGFAVSLIYVSYTYSGWNAAAYVAGEIEQPQKNLPRALFLGTLFVAIIYVLTNFVFLYTTPTEQLVGKEEIGLIAAQQIFPPFMAKLFGGIISVLLISTISAMVLAGPRVIKQLADDHTAIRFLGKTNQQHSPYIAIIFQTIVSIILILTSTFGEVLTYTGFILSVFTFLTVAGIFIARAKTKEMPIAFKTPLYPITPIIFLVLSGWTLFYVAHTKTTESLYGLLTLLIGIILYLIVNNRKKNNLS